MKILMLADEATKTDDAGSGQAGALAQALAALGHEVRMVTPKPSGTQGAGSRSRAAVRVAVPHVGGAQIARIDTHQSGRLTQHRIAGGPLRRGPPGARAAFFSLAALGLCRAEAWAPDIVHAASALAGPALHWLAAARRHDAFFKQTRTVFTIGDLAKGRGGEAADLLAYGLAPADAALLPDWARATAAGLALAYADWLSADGPTRARELLTPARGLGFEELLAARRDRLAGILEGLDLEAWDPAHDRALAARYDEAGLERRGRNKRALQRETGLKVLGEALLVAVPWTGAGEVIQPAIEQFLADRTQAGAAQVLLLGTASGATNPMARALARRYAGQVGVVRQAGASVVRKVYGGADVVVVDSPESGGGLSHRIAMRYGAVPVARWSGSAADVVREGGPRGNGFGFADYNAASLLSGLRRARRVYGKPARWLALQRRGMQQARGWGWERAARAYLALYQQALAGREDP